MIKPQELRIGNYVFDIDGDVLQIGQILDIGVKFKNTSLSSRYEKIQPIPLTEEILLKFGFFKKLGNYELENFRFHISQPMNFDGFVFCEGYSVITDKIQFVHQLQNLFFALTGEELTFKKD